MGIVNLRPAVARNLLTTVGLGLTMGLAACDCGDPESLAIRQPELEVIDPKTNETTRVGARFLADGSKERFAKKTGNSLGMIAPAREKYAKQ